MRKTILTKLILTCLLLATTTATQPWVSAGSIFQVTHCGNCESFVTECTYVGGSSQGGNCQESPSAWTAICKIPLGNAAATIRASNVCVLQGGFPTVTVSIEEGVSYLTMTCTEALLPDGC
jgi:hypothetical protein